MKDWKQIERQNKVKLAFCFIAIGTLGLMLLVMRYATNGV